MNRALLLSAFTSCVALAVAQDPAPSLVVRGGRLFEPERGAARPLEQLWIAGEIVLGERPAATPIPAGAVVLEADGHTVLPGLFDLHAHVVSHGGSFTMRVDPVENLETALLCGVAHVVDLHGDEREVFALRERSRSDGQLARLWAAGAAFTAPRGHGTQFRFPAHEVTSAAEVQAHFAALLPQAPDVIKLIVEHGGWGGLPRMPTLSNDLVQAVVAGAHAGGKRAWAHIWRLDEAKLAVAAGADALVHGVFLGQVDAELTAAMAKAKVAYVPTLAVVLASARAAQRQRPYDHDLVREVLHPELAHHLDDREAVGALAASPMVRVSQGVEPNLLQNLRDLAAAGVPIGLGTDAGNPLVPHGPGVMVELELYVAAGLTPGAALHAATLGSAAVLGVADRFGSLEPGKVADLVLVAGDPTARIADVWQVRDVVKAGRRVDRAAMRERNRVRALPPEVVTVRSAAGSATAPAFPFGGRWEVSTDAVAGGKSTAALVPTHGSVLHVRGEIVAGFAWGPWAGATTLWHPDRRRLVDASACTGVRLRLRGTSRALTVTLQCAAVKDANVFIATIEPTAELRDVEIPFTALKQLGYGKKVAWTGADMTGIALEFRCAPMVKPALGAVELEVAAVEFY